MAVLLFAELSEGTLKKPVLEAATYAYDLAQNMNTQLHAVSVGPAEEGELEKLGTYGVSKVHMVKDTALDSFINAAYASAVAQVAKQLDVSALVLPQSYNSRAIAPRLAVKLKATPITGVISLPDPENGFDVHRMAYSGKGIQELKAGQDKVVFTLMPNSYGVKENPVDCEVTSFSLSPSLDGMYDAIAKEVVKLSEGVSLTEADIVVSAGRGLKGPENWPMIEELAQLIGAATACSKPVADMEWRPHHEHVGQTGIQISPNVYFAIGISGAIQHLAGVSASKNIIVINKDPEAPFFKIADYGIIGDLFDVVPQMIEAIKKVKTMA